MKRWMIAVVAGAVLAGCQSNRKDESALTPPSSYPPMNQASLDVPTGPTAPPASYTPPPQPVVYDAPAALEQPVIGEAYVDASEPYVAAPEPGRRATSGTRYTVKKGESLWSIAQTRYGSGQKWKTIAAANPDIDPDRIQAGQTIVLP